MKINSLLMMHEIACGQTQRARVSYSPQPQPRQLWKQIPTCFQLCQSPPLTPPNLNANLLANQVPTNKSFDLLTYKSFLISLKISSCGFFISTDKIMRPPETFCSDNLPQSNNRPALPSSIHNLSRSDWSQASINQLFLLLE